MINTIAAHIRNMSHGVKTGYTRGARQAIVGSVSRDGHRVYVVLLRAANRTADKLLSRCA